MVGALRPFLQRRPAAFVADANCLASVALGILLLVPQAPVHAATLRLVDTWSNTRFVAEFGAPGKRIYGSLDALTAVKMLSDQPTQATTFLPSVILADANDDRLVWRYYDSATHQYGFRGYGQQYPGMFTHPHGVAARSTGEVYVADTGRNRIMKFSFSANQFTFAWIIPSQISATP
ncbi:MAG: hypothetical protein AAB152_19120 [Candidatus Coatesbacteria bacterium]